MALLTSSLRTEVLDQERSVNEQKIGWVSISLSTSPGKVNQCTWEGRMNTSESQYRQTEPDGSVY